MTELSTEIPLEIRAGDTAKWQRSFSDYPAGSGWVLAYTIVGQSGVYNFAGVASADDFLVTIAAATSANWAPGYYQLTEYVTLGAERYTTASKSVRVLENLASANTPADTRSHAKKMLDAIEAWLERKAPTSASVEIAGRKIQNYDLADLLALRSKYQFEVNQETRQANGLGSGKLLVRF